MTIREFEELKQLIGERREAGLKAVEERYHQEMKSVESVWNLINETRESKSTVFAPIMVDISPRNNTYVAEASGPTSMIREAINSFDRPFEMPDVHRFVRLHFGRELIKASISSCLNKICRAGEIVQVRAGSGRSPAQYLRKDLHKKQEAELNSTSA